MLRCLSKSARTIRAAMENKVTTTSLRLPAIFADHMVLQRDLPIRIWGWCRPGGSLLLQLATAVAHATADATGRWEAELPPQPAGGPHELSICVTDSGEQRILRDVMIGEVWLCSGQSNMQVDLASSANGPAEAAQANVPGIRLFRLEGVKSSHPVADAFATWRRLGPDSASTMTAVGYYFARHLHSELGVPVGIIQSAWGASALEPWISPAVVQSNPVFAPLREAYARLDARGDLQPILEEWSSRVAQWQRENPHVVQDDAAQYDPTGKWRRGEGQMTDWQPVQRPFVKSAVAGCPGSAVVWYRRRIAIPAGWRGRDLVLSLGCIDAEDITFIDGTQVGCTDQHTPVFWLRERIYNIPAGLAADGSVTLVVRAKFLIAEGNWYPFPQGLRLSCPSLGEEVPLDDGWEARIGCQLKGLSEMQFHTPLPWPWPRVPWDLQRPAHIHHGMIRPIAPYTIRGALWYQGESNCDRAATYAQMLNALIRDWRQVWRLEQMHFGIVQLPNFGKPATEPGPSDWADLRWAQYCAAASPANVGIVPTLDIGEADNIHPANKRAVGQRLADWALATAYGRPLLWSGPRYAGHEVVTGAAVVRFSHCGDGLTTADGHPPREFAIAGDDGKFHRADAQICGPQDVVLRHPAVPQPRHIWYACSDNPQVNLVGSTGLPTFPFRTDLPASDINRPSTTLV